MLNETRFDRAFAVVLGHEGGYQALPQDRGNYTPGGLLKGTKWGISARSYPDLDIKNLTQAQAKQIYRADFWNKYYDLLKSEELAIKVFDFGVNAGPKRAVQCLQRAIAASGKSVVVDGVMGPNTTHLANSIDSERLVQAFKDQILIHYKRVVSNDPTQAVFANGWKKRANA